jgi:Ribbon-helix-helix protein, copG family
MMVIWLKPEFCGATMRRGASQMSRPRGKKPSVRLSVSVNATDHAELARFAQARDLSVAWVVRRAISDFVERHHDELQGELHLPRGHSPEGRAP